MTTSKKADLPAGAPDPADVPVLPESAAPILPPMPETLAAKTAIANAAPEQSIIVNSGGYQNVVKVGFWQADLGKAVVNFALANVGLVLTNTVALAEDNRLALENLFSGPFGQFGGLIVTGLIGLLVFLRSRYADKTTPRVERLGQDTPL